MQNNELCQCGHQKKYHIPFDKPTLGISDLCGWNKCDCEQFRPTYTAPDALPLASAPSEDQPGKAPVS